VTGDRYVKAVPFLRSWSEEAAAAEPFPEPYVSLFRGDGKSLLYVAGDHVYGVENATIRTLEKAFREFEPQAVVAEGFGSGEASDPSFLEEVLRCARPPWDQCSERDYAVFLAHRAGIPFAGGEPDDVDILHALKEAGRSVDDMLGFYLLRSIPGWRRGGMRDAAAFEREAERFLRRLSVRLGGPGFRFGLPDFLRWFERHNAAGKPLLEITEWDAGPRDGPEASFFNAICRATELPRERSVLGRIAAALDRHDRALVIYGSGHLVKSRKALEAMLGKSVDSKPF
jgi:hypothetical protein